MEDQGQQMEQHLFGITQRRDIWSSRPNASTIPSRDLTDVSKFMCKYDNQQSPVDVFSRNKGKYPWYSNK